MNKQERINYLLRRRLDGSLTPAELDELTRFIDTEPHLTEKLLGELMAESVATGIYADEKSDPVQMRKTLENVLAVDRPGKNPEKRRFIGIRYTRWAAAAMFILMSGIGIVWLKERQKTPAEVAAALPGTTVPVDYVRTFLLPDSSLVVLQAGSTLSYSDDFGQESREVELIGEAFFDIRQVMAGDHKMPFVIYSGDLKTTVLGTSFNIKAYPGQPDIIVSVVKGKVRIENKSEVLAILTEDQQISYFPGLPDKIETRIEAEKAIEWTRADLEFRGETFEEIAQVLERRFNVSIAFRNESLKNCITIATFSGTETLENILEALCTIRGTGYYYETPTHLIIEGDGCE